MIKTLAVIPMAVVLMSVLFVGCGAVVTGSGNLETETFDFSDFTKVEAHDGFQVELKESSDFSIEITIDDNLQEYLEVTKSGDTLMIRLTGFRLYASTTLSAKITMPDISRLDLSGGSQADVTGFNLSHDLSIELSGGSRINGDVSAADVDLELSGGSRIELVGSADNLVVDGSGGSRLELGSFPIGNANIKISGGGTASISISGALDVDLSGGSKVIYTGEPIMDDIILSGGSTVSKK